MIRTLRSLPKSVADSDSENQEPSDEDDLIFSKEDDFDGSTKTKARILTPHNSTSDGQSVYGFVTPKRKNALSRVVEEGSLAIRTSAKKTKIVSSSKKPKSLPPSAKSKFLGGNQEITTKSVHDDGEDISVGKYTLRKRGAAVHIRAVNEVMNVKPDSDSELSDDDSNDSEDAELSDDENHDSELGNALDEYFYVHSGKTTAVTSNHTLAALHNPKMDRKDLIAHLKNAECSHIKETVTLQEAHQTRFSRWSFQMNFGFNILLYGLGSKRGLLEKFRVQCIVNNLNATHLVVNGYFPSLTIKDILNTITDDLLNEDIPFKNIIDQYTYIKKRFDLDQNGQLYLVIHNIDGTMLRSQKAQNALASLASSKNIHVIASIDHINAPLIWDQTRLSDFNWLWNDCTTFSPYTEETSYENSLLVQQTGGLALSSLTHVLRSLTPNAKGIFDFLVHYQLENSEGSNYIGISFTDLYNKCRERFLVNSDLTLRAQLTEFRDHKLIKSKKVDGVEYLLIPLDASTLKQHLEGQ